MAYTINKTTGEILITLLDGTADGPDINPGLNVSDIDLFGKNYPFYGQYLDENFIKLLQNFANAIPPTAPLEGELWYDISQENNKILRIFDGISWTPVTPIWVSPTAPLTTQVGAQWWNNVDYQLSIFDGTEWTVAGPAYKRTDGKSGGLVETVTDTTGQTHTLIKFYTNNNVLAVASYDQPYTLNAASAITGFSVINPGITLAEEANNLFYGTATNSQQLGNIAASNYARNDIDSQFSGNITIGDGNLVIYTNTIPGTTGIYNSVVNGNISFFTNNGNKTRFLHMNGSTGEVTVNQNPSSALGVVTKQYSDNSISTAISPLATIASPAFTGVPTAPNVAFSANTDQIATISSVQGAINNSTNAKWQGSNKTVSTNAPVNGIGNAGDFWFQI